jgi:hypothetical protein
VYKFLSSLGEILKSLPQKNTRALRNSKQKKNICILQASLTKESFTYHTLDIQDGGCGVNVPLGSQCAGWKHLPEGPLELLDMILDVSIHQGDLHELVQIHLPKPLDLARGWPSATTT